MRTLINELDYWIEKHNIRPEAPKALGACGRSGHAAESPELLGGLERSTAGLMPEPAGRREKGEPQPRLRNLGSLLFLLLLLLLL